MVGTAPGIEIDWNRTCEGKSGSPGLESSTRCTWDVLNLTFPKPTTRPLHCFVLQKVLRLWLSSALAIQLPAACGCHLSNALANTSNAVQEVPNPAFIFPVQNTIKRCEFPGIVESWFLKMIRPVTNASSYNLLWPCQARIEGHPSDPATAPAQIQHRENGWHRIKQSQLYTMLGTLRFLI